MPARVIETKVDEKTGKKMAHVSVPIYADEKSIVCDGGKTSRRQQRLQVSVADYPNQVLPLQNVSKNGDLLEIKDMVELPFLHEVRTAEVRPHLDKTFHSLLTIL